PVLCFVSRTPRPPRSTLFPYTTLFRSTRNQWTWGRSFSNTAAGQLRIHTGFPLGPGEEVASSPGAPKACPRYWARARFVNQYLGLLRFSGERAARSVAGGFSGLGPSDRTSLRPSVDYFDCESSCLQKFA